MEQDFGIGKSRPEANRAERPGFRIAAKKKKCREPEESQRPIARPGDSSCLRDQDRKSTRLNSSHITISYAVFCLKKKKKKTFIQHIPNYHRHQSQLHKQT